MSGPLRKNDPVETMRQLNAVSPCFCLAKWLQVTVDIVHGTNHSCHHPERHPIPIEELKRGPQALHNTLFKKEQRRAMLEGKRPAECGYCWDIEDAGSSYSDRIIKSHDDWAKSKLADIAALSWDTDVAPSYLEVMLDDRCNLSCAYCMADISSSIDAEMKKHGPYPVSDKGHRMPYHAKPDPNPYIEAFWEWLPMILPELRVLRVTGGEPLISPRLKQLLDMLETSKNEELKLIINSHLSLPESRIDSLCMDVKARLQAKAIGGFDLYTSLDAWGDAAEYLRHGMSYPLVLKNIEKVATELPDAGIVIMCAFNLLSLSTFGSLLLDVSALKKRFPNVVIDLSYLRNPDYLSARIATPQLKRIALAAAGKARNSGLFSAHEMSKIENALRWMNCEHDLPELSKVRRDFILFAAEYDRRKNRSFLGVFPDYREFYVECKKAVFAL